jgi:hypothetical protein
MSGQNALSDQSKKAANVSREGQEIFKKSQKKRSHRDTAQRQSTTRGAELYHWNVSALVKSMNK